MAKIRRERVASVYLEQRLIELNMYVAKAGWFASSHYENGGPPVAYVASIQEFGYAPHNLPPRMGLRHMIDEKQTEWKAKALTLAYSVLNNQMNVFQMVETIGQMIASDIYKQIVSVLEPALKESTLRSRASRMHISFASLSETAKKPLENTGYMLATVQYLVGMKNGVDGSPKAIRGGK